jgi:hypothetical protein
MYLSILVSWPDNTRFYPAEALMITFDGTAGFCFSRNRTRLVTAIYLSISVVQVELGRLRKTFLAESLILHKVAGDVVHVV